MRLPLLATALLALAFPATAQSLPPLPPAIKAQGLLRAGVRCDQPPYGYRTEKGEFAGVEVEMARQIAAWAFGAPDKIELVCVTAENRIPQLNAKRVDLLIATLGVTPERARVVDFAEAYRWGGSDLIVKKNSPIRKLDDVKGKTVIMLRGTTQSAWFDANTPTQESLRLNTISDALQALLQDRGDAFAADAATLIVIAAHDPTLRMVSEPFAISDAAIGLRKNEPDWMAYLNAAQNRMKAEGLYAKWLVQWVPEDIRPFYAEAFEKPRPQGR